MSLDVGAGQEKRIARSLPTKVQPYVPWLHSFRRESVASNWKHVSYFSNVLRMPARSNQLEMHSNLIGIEDRMRGVLEKVGRPLAPHQMVVGVSILLIGLSIDSLSWFVFFCCG